VNVRIPSTSFIDVIVATLCTIPVNMIFPVMWLLR
jgi:hypothetical protein